MSPVLRNVLAVIAGLATGMVVNMGLIIIGAMAVPPPEGVDPMNAESIAANIHLFEVKHFIFPFLAHAIGTLAGAFVATKIGASRHLVFAMTIGGFFFVAGIINLTQIPAPLWFAIVDVTFAYLPMGWLGYQIGRKRKPTFSE